MIRRTTTFIDTDELGLVVQIQHNQNDTVYPTVYETDGSGHNLYLSLFDSRIAEVKALDPNVFQITFASSFAGFLDLLSFDVKSPSLTSRIIKLETVINDLPETLDKYANVVQWKQMNAYTDKQIKDLKKELTDIRSLYNSLAKEVSEL
jgi:hypothetical protein